MKNVLDFNPKSFFDSDNNFISIPDLPDNVAKQITEFKLSETKHINKKTSDTRTETRTINIKLGNKDNARKELAKLQEGIFNHTRIKTIQHTGSVQHELKPVEGWTEEELNKALMIEQKQQGLLLDMPSTNDIDNDVIEGEIIE